MTNDSIKNINNTSELNVGRLLEAYLEPYSKEIKVHVKMSVKDVFSIPQDVDYNLRQYYLMAHFDFVICSVSLNKPLFAVEYDGPYHEDDDSETRDTKKNNLCDMVGFTLMRINYKRELFDIVKIIDHLKIIIGSCQSSALIKDTIPQTYQLYNEFVPPPVRTQHIVTSTNSLSSRKSGIKPFILSVIILTIISVFFSMFINRRRNYENGTLSAANSIAANTTAISPINIDKEVLLLSFTVGKHPGSRGTYIEIRDGKKTIVSGIYSEGTEMEFFKDKKVSIAKAGTPTKTFQLVNNIIDLEVANDYTKVLHGENQRKSLRKFKYDFENDKIIKK